MNEKLQRWSLIAEIVGGLAVVVTLIVLIIEVRENSELTRTSAYQQEIQNFNDWRNNIIASPDQVRVFGSWARREEIPNQQTDDGMLLTLILQNLFTSYESGFYSRDAGILGESEWDRVQRNICYEYQRAISEESYWGIIAPRLSTRFLSYMETDC